MPRLTASWIALLAIGALSCATTRPEPALDPVLRAYQLFADGDCNGVQAQAESADTSGAEEIAIAYFTLLGAYCLREEAIGMSRAALKLRADYERKSPSSRYQHAIQPLARVNPQYPRAPLAAGIEGWVMVDFEIADDGSVRDPTVLDSDPPFLFDGSALYAIRNWMYESTHAREAARHVVKLDFQINWGDRPRLEGGYTPHR